MQWVERLAEKAIQDGNRIVSVAAGLVLGAGALFAVDKVHEHSLPPMTDINILHALDEMPSRPEAGIVANYLRDCLGQDLIIHDCVEFAKSEAIQNDEQSALLVETVIADAKIGLRH